MTIFFLRDREINVIDFRSGSIKLMGEGGVAWGRTCIFYMCLANFYLGMGRGVEEILGSPTPLQPALGFSLGPM